MSKTRNQRRGNSSKNKNVSRDSTIDSILERADTETKDEFDDDAHYRSEHYLRVSKAMSKNKFTAIDVLSPNDIVPLKRKAMAQPSNEGLKQQMLDKLRRESYRKWLIELKCGFNILCHGVGSKKSVLEDFGRTHCCHDPDGVTFRVSGFHDDLTMKTILFDLTESIIDKTKRNKKKNDIKSDKDIIKHAENVVAYLEKEGVSQKLQYKYFYLIIHNIAGKMLRKHKIQRALSVLANCRFIHMIASMDHIHGLMLWDRNDLSSFHWIYHDVTTFKHYFEEMEFERDETIKLSNNGANHGLEHIMSSLTPQHHDIIMHLAEYQLSHDGMGLPEMKWYQLCEDTMLVSNSLKFKQYITEFVDHNVIVEQKVRGNMVFTIPYSADVIQNELIDYGFD